MVRNEIQSKGKQNRTAFNPWKFNRVLVSTVGVLVFLEFLFPKAEVKRLMVYERKRKG